MSCSLPHSGALRTGRPGFRPAVSLDEPASASGSRREHKLDISVPRYRVSLALAGSRLERLFPKESPVIAGSLTKGRAAPLRAQKFPDDVCVRDRALPSG